MTWETFLVAAVSALFAETLERAGAERDMTPVIGVRSRLVELFVTVTFSLTFAAYGAAVCADPDGEIVMSLVSGIFGALLARIAISDARIALIPDELTVVTFAVLPIWKWACLSGGVPDFTTSALLGAAGIGVLLGATTAFILIPAFRMPPVDFLLAAILVSVPGSVGAFYVEAAALTACFLARRAFPRIGTFLMRPEAEEAMRTDSASIFNEDAEAQGRDRYFPLSPFAAAASFVCVVWMAVTL